MTYKPQSVHMTPEQTAKARNIFDHFDKNKDGKLSLAEAKLFMLKYEIDPAFIPLVFEICDVNKDGGISFDEFNSLFMLLGDIEDDPSVIYRDLFNKFDEDHNGYLEKDEIFKFFRFIFKNIQDKKIKFYADYFDTDHDGRLDYDEIIKILDILENKDNLMEKKSSIYSINYFFIQIFFYMLI